MTPEVIDAEIRYSPLFSQINFPVLLYAGRLLYPTLNITLSNFIMLFWAGPDRSRAVNATKTKEHILKNYDCMLYFDIRSSDESCYINNIYFFLRKLKFNHRKLTKNFQFPKINSHFQIRPPNKSVGIGFICGFL